MELYVTKFGTLTKFRLIRNFDSSEFETTRVNCTNIFAILLFYRAIVNIEHARLLPQN